MPPFRKAAFQRAYTGIEEAFSPPEQGASARDACIAEKLRKRKAIRPGIFGRLIVQRSGYKILQSGKTPEKIEA